MEKRVSTILSFVDAVGLMCQLAVTVYLWSNTLPPHTPATYYLSSHSNLVIKLHFRVNPIKSSSASRILWNMCYFPLHYFSCVLRCFLSVLIIVTCWWGNQASSLWEITSGGVLFAHAVSSSFSVPELELCFRSHWVVVDCWQMHRS